MNASNARSAMHGNKFPVILLGLAALFLSPSVYAQGAAAPAMFAVKEIIIQPTHFSDAKAAEACGLSGQDIDERLTKILHDANIPVVSAAYAKPQMIDVAIQKAGVEVSRAVMVGDTVHDMHMARAAGVAAIGVAWGYHLPVDLAASGADIVIDRFDQLEPAIDRLLGQDA